MDDQNQAIRNILTTCRSIAVVGYSSRQSRAGYYVPAYLKGAGYRIYPVNPYLRGGPVQPTYPDLASIPDPVDLVLIFRRPEHVPPLVDAAIEKGAKAVWMQLGIVNEAAAEKARQAGLEVVMDACMLVEHRRFLPAG